MNYVIACMRHTGTGSYAVSFWKPNKCGYTTILEKAGRYTEAEANQIKHGLDDFPIEEGVAMNMSVLREVNYNGWEKGHFVLNDEVFWNTFDIKKSSLMKLPSDKHWFRHCKEIV